MLAFLLVLIAVGGMAEFWSCFRVLDGIDYRIGTTESTVEPGAETELVSTVINRSVLPKMYVNITETLPDATLFGAEGKERALEDISEIDAEQAVWKSAAREATMLVGKDGKPVRITFDQLTTGVRVSSKLYLLPRQRLERRLSVSFRSRGRRVIKGAYISCGDLLGFTSRARFFPAAHEIIVIPARLESPALTRLLGGFLGDISVKRFMYEDPVLTVGLREYTGTEPMRDVAWTKSAASEELLVKKYDYTLEPTATVLLNVECKDWRGDGFLINMEKVFSAARTVCESLSGMGVKFSFVTNAHADGKERIWPDARDGLGKNHLLAIFEGLGRATYFPDEPFTRTLARAVRRVEQGRSHIVITPRFDERYRPQIARLKLLSGCDVLIVETDKLSKREGASL